MKFWLLTITFCLLVFVLNSEHQTQQGTYENFFLRISNNVLNTFEYKDDVSNSEVNSYPIWGYTLQTTLGKLLGNANLFNLSLQFIMALLSVECLYRIFQLRKELWHIPFLFPHFMLMSVKWPDASSMFCIMCYGLHLINYFRSSKKYEIVLAAVCFGVLINLRTEYVYIGIGLILLSIILHFIYKNKRFTIGTVSSLALAFLFLIPWTSYQFYNNKNFLFTATNGGNVAYISLGQLPNNKWQIKHNDSFALNVITRNQLKSPYSLQGDSLLKVQFIDAVKSDKLEFAKKVAYNFGTFLISGLYMGESGRLFNENYELSIAEFSKWNFDLSEHLPAIIDKLLRLVSIPLLLLLVYSFIRISFSETTNLLSIELNYLFLGIVIFKIALMALLQYEPRHSNSLYLPLLGYFLLNWQYQKKQIK